MVFETKADLSEHGHGMVETLEILLSETHGTRTQDDILLAALGAREIPDELVRLAWDSLNDYPQ